jgi:hypothetical protein
MLCSILIAIYCLYALRNAARILHLMRSHFFPDHECFEAGPGEFEPLVLGLLVLVEGASTQAIRAGKQHLYEHSISTRLADRSNVVFQRYARYNGEFCFEETTAGRCRIARDA